MRVAGWFLPLLLMGSSLAARCLAQSEEEELPPRRFALVVGVRHYRAGQPLDPLKLAENDAHDLARVLKQAGYRVTLLSQRLAKEQDDIRFLPLREGILDWLKLTLSAPRLGPQDTVLVALAGHGGEFRVRDPANPQQEKRLFCFLPQDTDLRGLQKLYDQGKLPSLEQLRDKYHLLPLEDLYGPLQRCGAGTRLLLVDACRNDPTVPEFRSPSSKLPLLPPPPGGLGLLMSCSQGQRAVEDPRLGHGVFFHHVIEGLQGRADLNQNGVITLSELNGYVSDRVHDYVQKKYRARQTPEFKGVLRRVVLVPELKKLLPPMLKAPFSARAARQAQEAWSKHLDTPVVKTNSIGMKLVLIPPGEFQMGSTEEELDQARKYIADSVRKKAMSQSEQVDVLAVLMHKLTEGELPQHRVRITRPFYLGVYEVTQAEFQRVMGRNPSWFSPNGGGKDRVSGLDTSRFPVETVSWYDAVDFCNRLSQREGLKPYYRLEVNKRDDDGLIKEAKVTVLGGPGYHLPTEAQWEYACRAGTTTPFHFGRWSNGTRSNVAGRKPYGTTQKGPYLERTTWVGNYQPNAFGLFDTHGNVWEWCQDWYDAKFYSRSPTDDPVNRTPGKYRVLRGGSWNDVPWLARSASRLWNWPVNRGYDVGFRLARIAE